MANLDDQTDNGSENSACMKVAADGLSVPEDVLLAALERPEFFSGQLLTDQDLSAMTRWTRSRLALSRLRDGWGIAHGLDVTVDPKASGKILVSAGYAVNGDGSDIVVAKEVSVDLGEIVGASSDPEGDVFDVDVWIAYAEHKTSPEPALARSTCSEVKTCDYTRIDETYVIGANVATDGDSAQALCDAWAEGFKGCADVAWRYETQFRSDAPPPTGATAAAWLEAFAKSRPLQVRPETEARIKALGDAPRALPEMVVPILYAMVQDYRLTYTDINEDMGAPHIALARVRMTRTGSNGSSTYAVQSIDAMAPFRRALARTPLPAPQGQVNVAPLIGRRLTDGDRWLVDHGLTPAWCEALDLQHTATPGDLSRKLEFAPFISLWTDPIIVYESDELGGERIAAIYGRADTRLHGATISRHADPDAVTAGGRVTLSYTLTNTGRTRLNLTVRDSLLPTGASLAKVEGLAPGESEVVSTEVVLTDALLAAQGTSQARDAQGNRIITSDVSVAMTGDDTAVLDTQKASLVLLQSLGLSIVIDTAFEDNTVQVGEVREYRLIAVNDGEEDLLVATRATATGMIDQVIDDEFNVPAGTRVQRSYSFNVVDDGYQRFTVKADAIGCAVGDRRVQASAANSVAIVQSYSGYWEIFMLGWAVLYWCTLGWLFNSFPSKVEVHK